VTSVDPSRPDAGQAFSARVFGSAFEDGATVSVGTNQIASAVFQDSNTIAISVPALEPGGYDVTVTNPDGVSQTLRNGIVARQPASISEDCRNMKVFFDFDVSSLDSAALGVLRGCGTTYQVPSLNVRVEGHADQRGTTDYNLALGQRRAESVKRFMTSQGVATSRISVISYGEERPAQRGYNESAWAANRRAEISLSE